jgi:hypothetical protein
MSHDTAECSQCSLSLLERQSQPELVQRLSRPRLGPARGGTHSPLSCRMMILLVEAWSDAFRSIRRVEAAPAAQLWAGQDWIGEV